MNLPASTRLETSAAGLERLVVSNARAEAVVYLQGAQVMHFAPCGQQPLLWAADEKFYAKDKKNRGGVPIFWPWFAPVGDKSHLHTGGWVRERPWKLESAADLADGRTALVFTIAPERELECWPATLAVRYEVTVGESLELRLTTTNHGATPVVLEEALHTYFAISDIANVTFGGLEKTPYLDFFEDCARKVEEAKPFQVSEPSCHIYFTESRPMTITDAGMKRRIVITPTDGGAAVLWSPGDERAAELKDLGPAWRRMVCLETANCFDAAIRLAPGASHAMGVSYAITAAN